MSLIVNKTLCIIMHHHAKVSLCKFRRYIIWTIPRQMDTQTIPPPPPPPYIHYHYRIIMYIITSLTCYFLTTICHKISAVYWPMIICSHSHKKKIHWNHQNNIITAVNLTSCRFHWTLLQIFCTTACNSCLLSNHTGKHYPVCLFMISMGHLMGWCQ